MNKIIKLSLLLMAMPLLLTSCLKEDNDVFGESSSLRLQKSLEETRTILRTPEKGWVMDYYVGTDQMYGGYAFMVKFDSLTVTASSEVTDGSDTSYYKLTTDNGPVLSFDTYNDVLHALATPSADNYEAYHADYEFQIVSATPELVVLRGRRTGNVMQMRPLTTTPEEYLKKVAETEKNFIVATLSTEVDGKNVTGEFNINDRQVSFTSATDSTFTHDCAFTFTDNGIRLYNEVDAYGKTLSDLSYNPETMVFTSNDKGSEQLAIQGHLPADYVYFDQIAGDYVISFKSAKKDGAKGEYDDVDVDVTLEANASGDGFVMKGLGNSFDINLTYDKAKGTLSILPQQVGKNGGNVIMIYGAEFDDDGGSISYDGMMTQWNMDSQNPVFTWVPTPTEDTPANSFILLEFTSGGEFVGQYLDSGFTFAGHGTLLFLQTLTKKTAFPEHQK